MKRHYAYLLGGLLFTLAPSLHGTNLKDDYERINRAVNNAFSTAYIGANVFIKIPQDNLYAERYKIQQQNIDRCQEAIDMLRPFVVTYSTDYTYRTDPLLMQALSEIEISAKNLIENTKIAQSAIKNSNEKPINTLINQFELLHNHMFITAESLKNTSFYLANKAETQKLLYNTAVMLESSAGKMMKDLKKEFIQMLPGNSDNEEVNMRKNRIVGSILKNAPQR